MERTKSLDGMLKAHPIDALLFGQLGAVTAHLCEDLSNGFIGKQFAFMDDGEFQIIARSGRISEINQIYWQEILFRVYWASALSIMRHQRWQAACISAFVEPANYLAFAAGLRGLLEGAQDASYSLGPVVMSLANHRSDIESALAGRMREKGFVNSDLEDRLIHFIYGRKLDKAERETGPSSHMALEPRDYRNAIGLPDDQREMFRQLYDDLCGICHPTAFSLSPSWKYENGCVEILRPEDGLRIVAICQKYADVISFALSLSITQSALCLKALNWFSLRETHCAEVECWNFDDVPAWRKAKAAALKGTMQY